MSLFQSLQSQIKSYPSFLADQVTYLKHKNSKMTSNTVEKAMKTLDHATKNTNTPSIIHVKAYRTIPH